MADKRIRDMTAAASVAATDKIYIDDGTLVDKYATADQVKDHVLAAVPDLVAIEGIASNGILTRTGDGTAAARTITAGAAVSVSDGDGVSGNPTITITDAGLSAPASFGTGDKFIVFEGNVPKVIDYDDLPSGSGDVAGPASSVANEIVLFDGTTGKLIKSATTTGLVKASSGVIDTAVAGTDYYNPGGTDVAVADGGTGQSTEAAAVGALISALTEDTAPIPSTDFVGTYDASATTGKKVLLSTIVGSAPGGPGIYGARYWGGRASNPSSATTLAVSANTLYTNRILVSRPTTFTRIGIDVTTLAAGNARLGLFKCGSDGAPSTLVLDAGTVSTGTTGVKEITISQALEPGFYFGVSVFDATPTVRAVPQTVYDLDAVGISALGTLDALINRSFTYGVLSGADPFGTPTFATGAAPLVFMRIV